MRVGKTFRPNYIDPKCLRELGYVWRFNIEEAFQDWMCDAPYECLREASRNNSGANTKTLCRVPLQNNGNQL